MEWMPYEDRVELVKELEGMQAEAIEYEDYERAGEIQKIIDRIWEMH